MLTGHRKLFWHLLVVAFLMTLGNHLPYGTTFANGAVAVTSSGQKSIQEHSAKNGGSSFRGKAKKILPTEQAPVISVSDKSNSVIPELTVIPELNAWPPAAAAALWALVQKHKNTGAYAVFDADNTLWRGDLMAACLAHFENRELLSVTKLDPMLRLIPEETDGSSSAEPETLHNYLERLCEADDMICNTWISTVFNGYSLSEIKREIDLMMTEGPEVIETRIGPVGHKRRVGVERPQLMKAQQQLLNVLHRNGINVYVVTAAHEEFVRMIVADPKYQYNVKPENVIGVSTLLKNPATGEITTTRALIDEKRYVADRMGQYVLMSFIWGITPLSFGKVGAALQYIDDIKKPILVAGDTVWSDGPMLLHLTDIAKGGIRLFVQRSHHTGRKMLRRIKVASEKQAQVYGKVTAESSWLVVSQWQLQETINPPNSESDNNGADENDGGTSAAVEVNSELRQQPNVGAGNDLPFPFRHLEANLDVVEVPSLIDTEEASATPVDDFARNLSGEQLQALSLTNLDHRRRKAVESTVNKDTSAEIPRRRIW